jgi:demethylmenaquinone methyltransferase/2-methoxy-6-polyprenyl-1,4-benzoquinol methylase
LDTNYDELARLESQFDEQFDKQLRDVGLRKLAPQAGERILVIGFETRHGQVTIAHAVGPSGKALGFDLSESDQFGCGDGHLLPYQANSLDGIFTSYSLERFDAPPLPVVLDECRRVLRQGGRIVVIGGSGVREQGPDRDPCSLQRMVTAAGFTIEDAELRRLWVPIAIVLAVKGSNPATGDRPLTAA